MRLKKALEDKEVDVRLVDKFLAEGKLSKKEFDSYLNGLEDCEGKYEQVTDNEPSVEITE